MSKEITASLIDSLLEKASASERGRTNFNLHSEMSDPVHRFCIAAMPDTVVRPHRHPGKWELTVMLRGEMTVLTFAMDGSPLAEYELSPSGRSVLELDDSVYHCFRAKTPVAFLEIKPGPYEKPEDMPETRNNQP